MNTPPDTALSQLGRYQVLNKVAQGGMAEIFIAKAQGAMGFERVVAIKLIHSHLTRDEEFVKMFIDEARITMQLHHRNIVQVFELDRAEETYFIAMEYVHGVNLYNVYERLAAQRRWIELPLALFIVSEVAKGLHFAHTRVNADGQPLEIIHRDISPQNILLSFEGETKITDFGIAKAAERLSQTMPGVVKGKYAYMAPEILQDKKPDPRVDVFASGVVLYELLVGENPFAGASAIETIENVLKKEVAPPSLTNGAGSAELDRIVMKALARDPDQRFQSGQALANALTEYGMNLTVARRDMATGDQSLALLLAELFEDQAGLPLVRDGNDGRDFTPVGKPTPVVTPRPASITSKTETPLKTAGAATSPTAETAEPPTDQNMGAAIANYDDDRTVQSVQGFAVATDRGSAITKTSIQQRPAVQPEITRKHGAADDPWPPPKPPTERQAQTVTPPHQVETLRSVNRHASWLALALVGLAALTVAATLMLREGEAEQIGIAVDSRPAGANVHINGIKQEGLTPLQASIPLDAEHIIWIEKVGYRPVRREIRPVHGTLPTIRAVLERTD